MTTALKPFVIIALENPDSIRVFEAFGIDYCCGARKPLAEACATRNIAVDEVLEALERAEAVPTGQSEDWTEKPLGQLASHIVNVHHAYVRKELPRLEDLAAKVVRPHGDTLPHLPANAAKIAQVAEELLQHCAKKRSFSTLRSSNPQSARAHRNRMVALPLWPIQSR